MNNNLILYNFNDFSSKIIGLLIGFFIASILSTIPAQTGDWGIIGGSIIVAINEILSKIKYQHQIIYCKYLIDLMNFIKIGIIYGIFVDAFKLGS
uniref:Uncharacterized protein ycf20 n=1 Tax=Spyridia filamentosa TaxID=196632 RepID=A0A1Z1MJB5_SPYFI|nr:hypothetical protein [Spyridia filamentosa]ARW66167.1 hypothetical protein [Spyridia filamentosa]